MTAKQAEIIADDLRYYVFSRLEDQDGVSPDEAGAIASACERVILESLVELDRFPHDPPVNAVVKGLAIALSQMKRHRDSLPR
jgi:hypothetical protein